MKRKVLVTDYAWESLEIEREILSRVGTEIVVSSSGEENELLGLAGDVEGIMTSWAKVTANVIGAARQCQVIARYGIGLDNIDIEKATQEGIIVTNVPAYCIEEVSDHAMALILACARKISFYDRAVKKGEWNLLSGNKMRRIRGKTLGLVGFGKIGQAMAVKAKGFGLRVIVTDPAINKEKAQEHSVEAVTFERLLSESDFISLHLPLNKSTNNLFGEKEFKRMKETSYIINTSRGGLIDVKALDKAIREKWISGAGLDVLPKEPPDMTESLLGYENVIITPHTAFSSVESVEELQRITATQVASVLSGNKPENIVNPDVLVNPKLRVSFQAT